MGSSKDNPTITNTTSQPWEPAQPYLKDVMAEGQQQFNQTKNAKPWTSNVLGAMHPWQARGLKKTYDLARQSSPGLNAAQGLTTGLMNNGGMTPGLNNVAGLFGQFANSADGLTDAQRSTAGVFNEFANSADGLTGAQRQAAGYMDPFARGDYQEDPRMLAALKAREGRAMNAASTSFGGGRYGSNAIGQGVGRSLAEAGDELMLQSNEAARNRQLQASGMLGDLYTTGAGQKMNAGGQLMSLYNTGAGQKLQGTQGMGNLYEGARTASLAAAGMQPSLEALKYLGADKMMQAGQAYTDRTQTERDALIKRFENQQAGTAGWDALAKYVGALSGMGKAGGTSTAVAQPAKRSGFEKLMEGVGLLGSFF